MTKDEALKMALEDLIWTTGSSDFSEGGQAYEGAKKCLFPVIAEIKKTLAQSEQEPVAWLVTYGGLTHIEYTQPNFVVDTHYQPLYAAPPRREWVGLTDEEIEAFDTWHDNREEEVGWVNPSEILAYIEAKLKEKNT